MENIFLWEISETESVFLCVFHTSWASFPEICAATYVCAERHAEPRWAPRGSEEQQAGERSVLGTFVNPTLY
jgi:hypothetical protein